MPSKKDSPAARLACVVEAARLRAALGRAKRVTVASHNIPIFTHLLLRATRPTGTADGGRLEIVSNDGDLQIVEALPARVEGVGAITLEAKTLGALVDRLTKAEEIAIRAEPDGPVRVVAGRSSSRLGSLDPGAFPLFDAGDETPLGPTLEIEGVVLAGMISGVLPMIANDINKPQLSGVHLHPAADEDGPLLRAVGSDGVALGCLSGEAAGAEGFRPILLGAKACAEIVRLGETADAAMLGLATDGRALRVGVPGGNIVLTTKLLDFTFPDYTRVIPWGNPLAALCDLEELRGAVARAALVVSKGRGLDFAFAAERLTIVGTSVETGAEVREELSVELVAEDGAEPPNFSIALSPRQMPKILDRLDGDTVTLRLAPNTANGVIISRRDGDRRDYFVTMPYRQGSGT